ncbi:MAG: DNA mismatch repair endonuclease MutL [Planctomycetes bacterium]|nr:DNA mismatch repair endonuclease MutL [Planctomycetota bacterium]
MASIRVLPVHMVNKIAAGEVIERPASVVKELLENALDAGAGRIDVTVEQGGKQLIRVSDDGGGMGPEDLAKAFVPHATSKLPDEEALFHIATLGFRGEALASIAAISHASIRTRTAAEDGGHEVAAGGEVLGEVRPCAAPVGTTVEVRDLFFNTPARRKFLRSDSTELGHIAEALIRAALPRRDVAFTLTHNGRRVMDVPPARTLQQRVADLFDPELAEPLIAVEPSDGDVRISGLVAPPSAARAAAKWQYLFLNGRYIRDRFCQHALREAYRGLIDPQRHPVAILFIALDPAAVDVNVHPTKIEVRFRDGQSVHSHLLAAVRETLQRAELRPRMSLPPEAPEPPDDARRQSLREALADFFAAQPAPQPHLHFSERRDRPSGEPFGGDRAPLPPMARLSPRPPADDGAAPPLRAAEPSDPPAGHAPEPARAPARRVMQVHNTYIVVADADGLRIIDQHALHERVLYNQLLERITAGPLAGQGLLLPATLPVTPARKALLETHADLLARLGIEVSDFGPASVAVQRFPAFLDRADPAAFVADLLDLLDGGDAALDPEHLLHSVLDMMACKAAVKAGDPLGDEEIAHLLDAADAADKSTACPHGRPTQIRLTLRDLEKQFRRG